jgi:hypothetical protein
MQLNLDVVIGSPEESVDMKSGLDTLQGVSDVARCIAETLLTGKVPERQNHKSDVRTTLKRSFSGSYGQIFSIEVHDEKAQRRLRQIGNATFFELVSYFLNESVHKDPRQISERAQRVINELGEKAESLTKQLRKSPLKQLHEVSVKFGYEVKIRQRKSRYEQIELAKFDEVTAQSIFAEIALEDVELNIAVTRLNINTGNGRLLVVGERETTAFGFDSLYIRVPAAVKKAISENLNFNNGRDSEAWRYLRITARPVKLTDGRVVKYIIKELRPD